MPLFEARGKNCIIAGIYESWALLDFVTLLIMNVLSGQGLSKCYCTHFQRSF